MFQGSFLTDKFIVYVGILTKYLDHFLGPRWSPMPKSMRIKQCRENWVTLNHNFIPMMISINTINVLICIQNCIFIIWIYFYTDSWACSNWGFSFKLHVDKFILTNDQTVPYHLEESVRIPASRSRHDHESFLPRRGVIWIPEAIVRLWKWPKSSGD